MEDRSGYFALIRNTRTDRLSFMGMYGEAENDDYAEDIRFAQELGNEVLFSSRFINRDAVKRFEKTLGIYNGKEYSKVENEIDCLIAKLLEGD